MNEPREDSIKSFWILQWAYKVETLIANIVEESLRQHGVGTSVKGKVEKVISFTQIPHPIYF